MGNTTASVHVAWRGKVDVAAKAISRCYSKLGYERAKKPPSEGGKHVVLLARPGQSYVSIYDSDNAKLDNGELKDLALSASKALRAPAVFTSLYDSDSYEFIVFFNGRQIDLLMTDAESYEGPLKRLSNKARPAKWNSIFSRTLSAEQITRGGRAGKRVRRQHHRQTIGVDRPQPRPASDELSGFSGRAGRNHCRILFQEETERDSRYSGARSSPRAQSGLTDYFDAEQSFLRSVYPAGFPVPVGHRAGRDGWL